MDSLEEGKISPYAFWAFYSLYNHLNNSIKSEKNNKLHNIRFDPSLNKISHRLFPEFDRIDFNENKSLFITWKKKSRHDNEYHLRGCIGTFSKFPCYYAIERYSLLAALEDPRFPPITKKELPLLKCGCNMLSNFTTIYARNNQTVTGDIFDWEIGKHGIELKFKYPLTHPKLLSATFLPDVMVEQGWDQRDTFINLIEKAGVIASSYEILQNFDKYFVQVIRYEGHKSVITYDQFEDKLEELKDVTESL